MKVVKNRNATFTTTLSFHYQDLIGFIYKQADKSTRGIDEIPFESLVNDNRWRNCGQIDPVVEKEYQ